MATSSRPIHRINRPYLHHIIREGDFFVCAICSTHYDSLAKAEVCLNRCWQKSATGKNLAQVRTFAGAMFRCPLCMRLHREKNQGIECVEECRKALRPRIVAIELEDLSPPPAKKIYTKPTRVLPARKPALKILDDEPEKPVKSAAPTPVETQEPAAVAAASPATEAPAGKKPRDRTKKFTRDNAKYICVECKKVYFTKKEVEDCFDAHE